MNIKTFVVLINKEKSMYVRGQIKIPDAEFKTAKTETQIDEVCQRWAKAWAKNKIVVGFNR